MQEQVSAQWGWREKKAAKPCQLGLIHPTALTMVGEAAGGGKYPPWDHLERPLPYRMLYDAVLRHLMAFWAGENTDPESGRHHLAHAAWGCLTLLTYSILGIGEDDRPHTHLPTNRGTE